jgi:hypothetical protein
MVMIMEKLDAPELLEHLVEQEVRAVSHVRSCGVFVCHDPYSTSRPKHLCCADFVVRV